MVRRVAPRRRFNRRHAPEGQRRFRWAISYLRKSDLELTMTLLKASLASFLLAATAATATAEVFQTYRLQCQTVFEDRQVTAYRVGYETVYDERQITTFRPVWETEARERRYTVARPVIETSEGEMRIPCSSRYGNARWAATPAMTWCATCMKPANAKSDLSCNGPSPRRHREEALTWCTARDRNARRDEVYTVMTPVTTYRNVTVDQGPMSISSRSFPAAW